MCLTMNPAHAAQEFATPDHRIVLRYGPQQITVKDVIDAAWFEGELNVAWTNLMEGMRCEQLASQEGLESEDEILQSHSEEFRYEKDLLTTEETEKWLAERDLSQDDFVNFFLRRYWRQRLGPAAAAGSATTAMPCHGNEKQIQVVPSYPAAAPDLKHALRAELWLGGEFDRLARRLAWRVVSLAQIPDAALDEKAMEEERTRFFKRCELSEEILAQSLRQLGRELAWFELSLATEIAHRRVLGRLLTEEQRSRELGRRRLGLTRVEIETLRFRTADAAREAVLCLREQETSMEELAHECGWASERRRIFIEDCADEAQHALWPAAPGDYLLLAEGDARFAVCRVIEKTEPHWQEADVRARIDSILVEAGFADLAGKNIRWVSAGTARQ
jgi:hypothetical protein